MKIKSRKHWYSYTGNLILLLFIAIPCIYFYFKTEKLAEISPYFRIGILIFGLWLFYRTSRGIILNSRVEWIFENNILTTKSGLLPWKSIVFQTDISQIFEAFCTKSFMGTILGFGALHIRRTDGVTSKIFEYSMSNHKKMVLEINKAISNYKTYQNEQKVDITSKESLSDELRKLADLNKDGVISDEEFQQLKKKIIE